MSRSPRAWWRAAFAGALIVLAAVGPAVVAPHAASGAAAGADAGPVPEASFVVAKARFEPLDGARPVGVDGLGDYAGSIEVVPDGGSVAVLDDVSVEDYVAGIAEMPSDWPAAALQAQAIAARSYLLHNAAAPAPVLASLGAQICASQDCQVYTGLAKARGPNGRQWLDAVNATAGQVLLYNGRPINAMYSSSNGGRTVAGGEPYLRAVDDPDDSVAPLDRWTADIGLDDLARALQLPGTVTSIGRSGDTVTVTSAPASSQAGPTPTTTPTSGPSASTTSTGPPAVAAAAAGPATTLPVGPPTTSPGPTTTAPVGSTTTTAPPGPAAPGASTTTAPPAPPASPSGGANRGSLTTSAADFTRRVNGALPPAPGRDVLLPSDRFTVTLNASTATFSGGGFGHGIGMSQYGALGKANRGLSAADILAFYYAGLRPSLLPITAVPSSVRVDLADGLSSATVTGRFRLVDEHGNVLITVGDGPWRTEPAPGGRVRVILPVAYHSQFGLAPVTVEPAVVLPGAKVAVHFNLPVPGLASVSATPPGAAPVTTDLGITAPGAHRVDLPPATTAGTYTLRIAAAAGVGRQADSVLEISVGTAPAGVPNLDRFSPPGRAGRNRAHHGPMTAGVVVAVVLLLSVSAVAGTAVLRPRRSS